MGGRKGQQLAATLLLVLALWGCTTAVAIDGSDHCDLGDLKALTAFKAVFHDPGRLFDTWRGADCCNGWEGVNCTNGRVTSLIIEAPFPTRGPNPYPKSGFTGSAAATLTDLTELVTLRVISVFFNSPLPDKFGNLKKLETLEFAFNNLSGSIPPSIGKAKKLTRLSINVNMPQGFDQKFEGGPIPVSYCDLKQLEYVSLTSSRLTGQIPDCICNWKKLISLELSVNALESEIPNCIGDTFKELEVLALDYNNFTGPIPAVFGKLEQLETLKLDHNQFSGDLPASIGNLTFLTDFTANDNKLGGPIPASYGNLLALVSLDLSNNFLNAIPAELGNLASLSDLNLRRNKIQGRLPAEIGNAGSGVEQGLRLDVSHNILTGKLPFTLGALAYFSAHDNFFYGPFPQSLASVEYVDVSNNFLGSWGDIGPAPEVYDVRILLLRNNRFFGPIPSWIPEILNKSRLITDIDISSNNFTGDIAPLFLDAPELRLLNASSNSFQSNLPATPFVAPFGSTLDLSHNLLYGPIPPSFFTNYAGAQFIDLSYNHLDGPLPNTVGNLDQIALLDLSNNELSGEVPTTIDNLNDTIQYLDLSYNNFTGPVPETLKEHKVSFDEEHDCLALVVRDAGSFQSVMDGVIDVVRPGFLLKALLKGISNPLTSTDVLRKLVVDSVAGLEPVVLGTVLIQDCTRAISCDDHRLMERLLAIN
ncbi:hypothetical protein R1sor_014946 [Riccia sorocarpa]|uniref:Leucine-rich repeat-containing N-terminal plant-type domain-containing protein n=1 Tax=Riccia sorocarpa TaxID=122646 RepID=A0ABD3HAU2_9MARC